MNRELAEKFAKCIKKFLDNKIGLYNLYITPDPVDDTCFFNMVLFACEAAGIQKEDTDMIIQSTKIYTDYHIAGRRGLEPNLIETICSIILK